MTVEATAAKQLVDKEMLEEQLARNRAELQAVREQAEELAERERFLERQVAAVKAGIEGYDWGREYALAEVEVRAEAAKRSRAARRTAEKEAGDA